MGDTYNIGCEEECTNLEIAQKLVQAVKPNEDPKDHIIFVTDRPFNDVRPAVLSCVLRTPGCTSAYCHTWCRARQRPSLHIFN